MYEGELAEAIVAESERAGGWLTRSDLAAFKCEWEAPLSSSFQGYDVFTPPPPCTGAQILETLKLVENLNMDAWAPASADAIHHFVEAVKIAAADRVAHGSQRAPWQALLGDEYARARAREIDAGQAAASAGDRYMPERPANFVSEGELGVPDPLHTTHFAVVDSEGNAVSTTQTLGTLFGAGCVVPGTGMLLNNKAYWADRDPSSPNRLAPDKKIEMSIAPVLVTHTGQLAMTVGSPGSFGILQIVPQLILNVLVHRMSPTRAVSAPRVNSLGLGNETYLQALAPRGDGRLVALESRIPRAVAQELVRRGHDIRYVGDWANLMGCGAIILRNLETGVLMGGADPRRDSQAHTW
jgi:gamma-glutamyltranspeptidase/glutathione hydrolase